MLIFSIVFFSPFSLFIGLHEGRTALGNPLQFLDKTFKRQNRTEMSQFHSSPNGNDPQTATIRGQGVGVGEGLIEKTG